MARDKIPISPDGVPEEARQYMAAVLGEQEHPLVRDHFHQVTWLSLPLPDHQPIAFFALEFRSGMCAALIWQDGQGNWGAGAWLPLPHADADITCRSGLSLNYFQGVQAHESMSGALEQLAAAMPS